MVVSVNRGEETDIECIGKASYASTKLLRRVKQGPHTLTHIQNGNPFVFRNDGCNSTN